MNNGWLKCSKVNKLELVIYEICLSSNYLDLAASFVFCWEWQVGGNYTFVNSLNCIRWFWNSVSYISCVFGFLKKLNINSNQTFKVSICGELVFQITISERVQESIVYGYYLLDYFDFRLFHRSNCDSWLYCEWFNALLSQ